MLADVASVPAHPRPVPCPGSAADGTRFFFKIMDKSKAVVFVAEREMTSLLAGDGYAGHPFSAALPLAAIARSGGEFTLAVIAKTANGTGAVESDPSAPFPLGVPLLPAISDVAGTPDSPLAIEVYVPQRAVIPGGVGFGRTTGYTAASQPFEFEVTVT